jgi:hypothetical protein
VVACAPTVWVALFDSQIVSLISMSLMCLKATKRHLLFVSLYIYFFLSLFTYTQEQENPHNGFIF